MHPKPLFIVLILWLCHGSVSAQTQFSYDWNAKVPVPAQSGYHSILLTPEIIGHLRTDLADIRLMDGQGQEVPFLIRKEEEVRQSQLFRAYSILSYKRQTGGLSELLIENTQQRKISNLSLLIKNADVAKQVSLSGSDNRQDWYALKAKDMLHAIGSTESTAKMKLLEFPLNDYRYLRLQLNDSTSAPLNILQAGYYDTQTETGKYTPIPVKRISRTDSAETGQTFIRLQFDQPVYPEQLDLLVTAPDLYLRKGYVRYRSKKASPSRKRKREADEEFIKQSFILNSNEPTRIQLPRQQVQELTLVIENGDNAPLKINQITPLQLNRYLVADLKSGTSYTLSFGNEAAFAPTYDIRFFSDSIPMNIPVLTPINVQPVKTQQVATSYINSRYLIWVAIGLVLVGLGFMTVRLLNEMNREKQ